MDQPGVKKKRYSKSILIVLALIILFTEYGIPGLRFTVSPSMYARKLFRAYYSKKVLPAETIWDYCVSEKTKSLNITSEREYVSQIRKERNAYPYSHFKVESSDEVQPGIYIIKSLFTCNYEDTEYSDVPQDWYIIRECGVCRLLLDGITNRINIDAYQAEGSEFFLDDLKVYRAVDGIVFSYDFKVKSNRTVRLPPSNDKMTVTLTTDDGRKYSLPYDPTSRFIGYYSNHTTIKIPGAKGTPAKLCLDGIMYVGSDGNPDETTSYTVTFIK